MIPSSVLGPSYIFGAAGEAGADGAEDLKAPTGDAGGGAVHCVPPVL